MNLTQWKKEESERISRELELRFRPINSGATNDFLGEIDTLIDRIHAHTLEEVRGKIKADTQETKVFSNIDEAEGYEIRNREVNKVLELLEHPTD